MLNLKKNRHGCREGGVIFSTMVGNVCVVCCLAVTIVDV